MRLGMVIDLNRCIGCRTCTTICKNHHSQPEGIWWNRVFTKGSDTHQVAIASMGDNSFTMTFLPVSCQMCENPSCVKVCPTGASYVDEDGVVLVDYERCVGCRYCMSACPYGVRQFNWGDSLPSKTLGADGYVYGYPYDYREEGRLVYTRDRPRGTAEKCTFCAQYRAQGLDPMCVTGCPANARIFGDLDNPESPISAYLVERDADQLEAHLGNNPKVLYVQGSSKDKPALFDPYERKEL